MSSKIIKYFALKYFFKRCDAFVTIGERNEEYYLHYGVSRERLYRGAYPVDVQRFIELLQEDNHPKRNEIRNKYGIPEKSIVVIALGKLISIKRQLDLVK